MRKNMLLLLLSMLCPLAWGDERNTQYLNEVDTRSHLLGASAMVYFNPNERSPQPRGLNNAFYHLNTLENRVQQLGNPEELAQPLQDIKRLFRELEGTPASQRERYPTLIRQLLVEQQKLQHAVAAQYAGASVTAQAQALNAQSQALSRLLLDYQLRRYPLPEKAGLTLPPAELKTLDSTIKARFDSLLADPATQTAVLRKASASYQFVRAELQKYRGSTQGGIEFYLSRVVLDLDELAMAKADAQP